MARQKGIFKMIGTLDDVTFYKSGKDGYVAKVKTEITKERIDSDPAFARMRENGKDFGRAGTAGKTLRRAFQAILLGADKRMVSRLQKVMLQVMKADTTGLRGEKQLISGDLGLLKAFEFNIDGPLGGTLRTTVAATLNRATGVASITVPAMVPTSAISYPAGATHYKIVGGVAAVNFVNKTAEADTEESAYLPIDNALASALALSLTLPANTTDPVFHVVGIKFFLDDNGVKYPLNNGAYNAMSIVNVEV